MFLNIKKIFASFIITAIATVSIINLPNNNIIISKAVENKEWEYTMSEYDITITSYYGNDENVIIPSTINGNKVVAIDDYTFYHNDSIKSIYIPESINYISSEAFVNCQNILDFNVSEENQYYTSVDGIIFSKNMSTIIKYPAAKEGSYIIPQSVNTINSNAFFAAEKLNSITIHDNIYEIGKNAFFRCKSLVSFYIPKNLTTISENMLASSGIESILIPSSINSIEDGAFGLCYNLVSVTIENGVETIGECAFFECKRLPEIKIPTSIKEIGQSAFQDCGLYGNPFVIQGTPGSITEKYSKSSGITFQDENEISYISKKVIPNFIGDENFDLEDMLYVKNTYLGITGFNISTEQWSPIDGEKIGISDVSFFKCVFLKIDGYN